MPLIPIYKTTSPSQYLAITGLGIESTLIVKKGWILPGQQYSIFDVSPENYEFDIQAMSSEMLPFILPAVFTIGPKLDIDELDLYAQLLATHDLKGLHVHTIIKGIVEGETRVLAASLTMKQIFEGTKHFKSEVFDKVQLELNQFGLKIYNANIKQLSDLPGHEYFSYLGQKTQKGAANQAKVDIAHADYLGNIGAKQREGDTVREVCRIQNETDIFQLEQNMTTQKRKAETTAHVEIKQNETSAQIKINKAKLDQDTRIASIEAEKIAQIREANLENELNQKLGVAATEKYRAEQYSLAVVETEIINKRADAEFYKKQREADAVLYQRQRELDAYLLEKQNEAESIKILAIAQSSAVTQMISAFNGNVQQYIVWKTLEEKLYEKLATCSAKAVNGLNPNISIWNTGNQPNDAIKTITDLCQVIPPLFSTIEQQTGMKLFPNFVDQTKGHSII